MALAPEEQARLRFAIFDALEQLIASSGGFATHSELTSFTIEGKRIALIDPNRGIRNPVQFDATLAIVSSVNGPYNDHIGDDGLLRYAFRAGNPFGGDNRKLRVAKETGVPIILFRKPLPNVYVPVMPAYVIDEDLDREFFIIATDDAAWRAYETPAEVVDKRYVAQLVRRRVHQPVFRAQVIVAYEKTCAVCLLRHAEMLDAAHIIEDSEVGGVAHVTNGVALCKIHHAAYDRDVLGIDSNYVVHIDRDVLEEVDGPMLKHGIQEMHGRTLNLPRRKADRPSRDALAERFARFSR